MARTTDKPPSGPDGQPNSGLESRVARLEAAVDHIERDIAEIKTVLSRLATAIDRLDGFLEAAIPALQSDIAKVETRTLRLDAEMAKRPTTVTLISVLAVMIAIAGLPYWGHWFADLKAMLGAHP